jgi:hypothetical protein
MRDHVHRRLRWFLLLGVTIFVAGSILWCAEALRTSAWMDEIEARPPDHVPSDEESERWLASVDIDNKLIAWCIVLLPIGAGTLSGAIAGLLWVTKGRFSLQSLFLGMTLCSLTIGPLAMIWPRLHGPRFIFGLDEHCFVWFEQRGKPASSSTYGLVKPWTVAVALVPLLAVPIISFWPRRSRPARDNQPGPQRA